MLLRYMLRMGICCFRAMLLYAAAASRHASRRMMPLPRCHTLLMLLPRCLSDMFTHTRRHDLMLTLYFALRHAAHATPMPLAAAYADTLMTRQRAFRFRLMPDAA